ncbi:helix-turn-helix domain-containing protein [Bacteroides stercoris]
MFYNSVAELRLDKNHGNVSKTAAELGCSRTALYKKMKKLGLK